jgi:hypothetical protein
MAEVTGTLGNESIELNNAATESTLRALLQATSGSVDKMQKIAEMAAKSGLSSADIDAANEGMKQTKTASMTTSEKFKVLSDVSNNVINSFSGLTKLTESLAAGTGTASSLFGALTNLPLGLGLIAAGFKKVAESQETSLAAYQKLTSAGINFSGSLTDMRLAASQSYLTLDQFSKLMTDNSTTLAKMGNTVNNGAKAFASMSNGLINSQVGDRLLALGYTTEDINNGLLTFIGTTGNAANSQKGNSAQLTQATAAYLTELDAIAQFTGANRKKMEEDQKKASEQAAFQRKLASMAPADAAKVKAAYDAASASGIKGATDLVMSTALGLPPMTEAARVLSGVMPDAARGIVNMTNTAMDNKSTMNDVNDGMTNFMLGAKRNTDAMGLTADAVTMMPGMIGEVTNSGLAAGNLMNAKGIQSAEDGRKAFKDIFDNQAGREKSQAQLAADTQKKVMEMGQKILEILLPLVEKLSPKILTLVEEVNGFVSYLVAHQTQLMALAGVVGSLTLGFIALKSAIEIKKLASDLSTATGGKGISGFGTLGTRSNPMYAIIVGGAAAKAAEEAAAAGGAAGSKGKRAVKLGLAGVALGAAGSVAEGLGANEQVSAGLNILGDAATGASIGEAIGLALAPATMGVSALVGPVLGGAVGGIVGMVSNWDKLFSDKNKEKAAEKAKDDARENEKLIIMEKQRMAAVEQAEYLREQNRILTETQGHAANTASSLKRANPNILPSVR